MILSGSAFRPVSIFRAFPELRFRFFKVMGLAARSRGHLYSGQHETVLVELAGVISDPRSANTRKAVPSIPLLGKFPSG